MAITSITPEVITFADGEQVRRLSVEEAARIPSAAEFIGLDATELQTLKAGGTGTVAMSPARTRRLVQLIDVLMVAFPDKRWDTFLADTPAVA
jgi:hypothetical protein